MPVNCMTISNSSPYETEVSVGISQKFGGPHFSETLEVIGFCIGALYYFKSP